MRSLRFNKSNAKMVDAAIILVTSQDPWAERVLCSLFDWPVRWHYWDQTISVMLDEFGSLHELALPTVETRVDHRFIITFDSRVPEGWVELP